MGPRDREIRTEGVHVDDAPEPRMPVRAEPRLYRRPGAVFPVYVNGRPMWPVGGDGSAAPLPGHLPDVTRAAVTVERRDNTAVITVTGEIDIANAETAETQIMQAIAGEPTTVTLDLTGLHYIDSAGLWILFRLGTSLTTADIAGEVVIPADGPVRRMVETAGVSAAIAVRTTRGR